MVHYLLLTTYYHITCVHIFIHNDNLYETGHFSFHFFFFLMKESLVVLFVSFETCVLQVLLASLDTMIYSSFLCWDMEISFPFPFNMCVFVI